jgi:hypothetical protein
VIWHHGIQCDEVIQYFKQVQTVTQAYLSVNSDVCMLATSSVWVAVPGAGSSRHQVKTLMPCAVASSWHLLPPTPLICCRPPPSQQLARPAVISGVFLCSQTLSRCAVLCCAVSAALCSKPMTHEEFLKMLA